MESEVISIIKSCVVIEKHGLHINDLERNYQNDEGEKIPYKKLGYDTLRDFLLNIPGLKLTGSVLTLRDEKMAHISELVQHQAESKKRKTKRPKVGTFASRRNFRSFDRPARFNSRPIGSSDKSFKLNPGKSLGSVSRGVKSHSVNSSGPPRRSPVRPKLEKPPRFQKPPRFETLAKSQCFSYDNRNRGATENSVFSELKEKDHRDSLGTSTINNLQSRLAKSREPETVSDVENWEPSNQFSQKNVESGKRMSDRELPPVKQDDDKKGTVISSSKLRNAGVKNKESDNTEIQLVKESVDNTQGELQKHNNKEKESDTQMAPARLSRDALQKALGRGRPSRLRNPEAKQKQPEVEVQSVEPSGNPLTEKIVKKSKLRKNYEFEPFVKKEIIASSSYKLKSNAHEEYSRAIDLSMASSCDKIQSNRGVGSVYDSRAEKPYEMTQEEYLARVFSAYSSEKDKLQLDSVVYSDNNQPYMNTNLAKSLHRTERKEGSGGLLDSLISSFEDLGLDNTTKYRRSVSEIYDSRLNYDLPGETLKQRLSLDDYGGNYSRGDGSSWLSDQQRSESSSSLLRNHVRHIHKSEPNSAQDYKFSVNGGVNRTLSNQSVESERVEPDHMQRTESRATHVNHIVSDLRELLQYKRERAQDGIRTTSEVPSIQEHVRNTISRSAQSRLERINQRSRESAPAIRGRLQDYIPTKDEFSVPFEHLRSEVSSTSEPLRSNKPAWTRTVAYVDEPHSSFEERRSSVEEPRSSFEERRSSVEEPHSSYRDASTNAFYEYNKDINRSRKSVNNRLAACRQLNSQEAKRLDEKLAQRRKSVDYSKVARNEFNDVHDSNSDEYEDIVEPTIFGYQMLGDDFFLHLAESDLGALIECKSRPRCGLCISGQTLEECIKHVRTTQPSANVIVLLGAIDILSGVHLEHLKDKMYKLVSELMKCAKSVALVTVPPLIGDYNWDTLVSFNKWICNLKNMTHRLIVIDLWSEFIISSEIDFDLYENESECVSVGPLKVVCWNSKGHAIVKHLLRKKLTHK